MAPSSIMFWYFASLILLAASQYENLCLWNRYLLNDRPTNGLYRRSTVQVNGKWYYKMDRSDEQCTGKYYYIFWYADAPHTGWYVGYGSTETFGFGIQSLTVAKCISGTQETPVDCDNWSFRDPYNTVNPYTTTDASVSASWGACPQLDCASITISNNGIGTCYGTAHQTGSNKYTSADGSWIWYFNQPFFQWTCVASSATVKSDSCVGHHTDTGLLNFAPTQTWQDLSAGQSITYDDSQGQTGTFTCAGTATTTTFAPTATFPTLPDIPTPHPTFKPIDPASWPGVNVPTVPTAPTVAVPTAPTVPTQAGGGDDTNGDDDDTNNNNNGGGGDDDDDEQKAGIIPGVDNTILWIIIIVIIVCCCCCVVGFILYKKKQQRKEQYFDA